MIDFKDQQGLLSLVSNEFSDWSAPVAVSQSMVDEFARLSGDDLWIHTDPEKCEKFGMGSTIAQGFLVLSLLSSMRTGDDITEEIGGYKQIMNYGSDKLRFLSPVPVGSEIHGRRRVESIVVEEGKTVATMEWEVSVVGQDRPNLVYQMMFVFM